MTIHNPNPNPNPAQNIYNAPTNPQYAIQSGNRNRICTIPVLLSQGKGQLQGSAGTGGTGGTGGGQTGSVQNGNGGGSGGILSDSGGRLRDRVLRGGGSQGRNMTTGGGGGGSGNKSGARASQHVSASGMHAQAQGQGQGRAQHLQTPVNYVHPLVHPQAHRPQAHHPQPHHPQIHHPQPHHPHPHNRINYIHPLVGDIFGPHAPHIPRAGGLLSQLSPYVPRTNLGGNRPIYGPPMQGLGLPHPFGYPQMGNMNPRGMGMGMGLGNGNGIGVMNVIDYGWDSRWDAGSGGDRGCGGGSGLRGGRGRRRR
ncbi:hypothetical protein BPOR_0724g00050 [Botrytis porri]|uniref:Uncharacterized protein n=1 Tax=Botrytis porri TaxID=87229 RepID=A0A4Z1KAE4_9HELO|nr:hypothetical protein BPOR_0724g00050 [Botrytis porri]